jgi:predicted GNAT superfamily acetyltransferase
VTTSTPPFRIRPLVHHAEMVHCVQFQKLIWGRDFDEAVPAAIMWVAHRTGGIIAGAFDPQDRMVGFVFGLSGWQQGRPVHWSDMLAVLPDFRGAGVGRRLKEYQYHVLSERGILNVSWTFDPLESRNAWLNFARLGITSSEYVRDCYGPATSPMHEGVGTDRVIADWRLDSERVRMRMAGEMSATAIPSADELAAVPLVNEGAGEPRLDMAAPAIRVRIPADIQEMKARSPELAMRWRLTVRSAFEHYFGRGYVALELVREAADVSSYVLVAQPSVQAWNGRNALPR